MNFIAAVAYHFCHNLPIEFTKPGASTLARLCTHLHIIRSDENYFATHLSCTRIAQCRLTFRLVWPIDVLPPGHNLSPKFASDNSVERLDRSRARGQNSKNGHRLFGGVI